MKLKRVSGKGHKWKKGQSCISNPQNSKFREAAKGHFFQKLEGESGLTKEALAKHDAALNDVTNKMDELGVEAEDLQSAGKSFNTFATGFTTCTIPAFEKFFLNFSTTSEMQTRMLAIHAAAQEYMTEAKIPETETSYFCSLIVSLEGIIDSENDVTAALALMSRVVRRVRIEVLRAKFGDFVKVLDNVLTQYQGSTNNGLLINAIGSISVLLRAQDREQWTYPYTLNLMQKLLIFTVHEKPKVRKSAQYNVSALLKGASFLAKENPDITGHPGAGAMAEFCISQIRAASEIGNTKTVLHVLVLLRQIIMGFPKKQLKSACECVISLMQLGNSLTNTCAMQALYSLLVSEPPEATFPAVTNSALICALTTETPGAPIIIPGMNDPQPACAWITVLTVAHINLFKLNEDQGMEFLAPWFNRLTPYWRSDHDEVQKKVFESFEALLEECVANCSSPSSSNQGRLHSIFRAVEECLSFQYQPAWGYVFRALGVCFTVIGPKFPDMIVPCLKNLTELMDNTDIPHRRYLEQAIGGAVRALGPKSLMAVVPLEITGNMAEDEKNLWVLPILKKYVRNTELCYFEDYFVHLAGKCFILLNSLKEKGQGNSLLAKTYQTVERQIWYMLPSFADKATDVQEVLGNEKFARILCDHIKFRDDTRVSVLAALRNMINDNLDNPGKLAEYSKNYMPALFNVYLTRPKQKGGKEVSEPTIHVGQREAAFATIRTYLQIVPQPKRIEFLGLVMTKYNNEDDSFKRTSFLHIARAFLPYVDCDLLHRLYQKVIPILNDSKETKVQKAAYRLLEELLSVETESGKEFITKYLDELSELLLKSLSAAASNTRAPRLRCVRHILLHLSPDVDNEARDVFLHQVVGESVMCRGSNMSEATRKAAFILLAEVGATIQKHLGCSGEDTVKHCLKILLAGLVGSPALAANTILAITTLTYQYKDMITTDVMDLLMQNVCVQLLCHSREIVAACLSFIKSSLTIFKIPFMSNYVDGMMKAICNMAPDCQKHFRLKTKYIFERLMRKFGSDRIMALVPQDDDILQKRLRNIRKLAARKKREQEEGREAEESSDEDDFVDRALPASLDEILAEIGSDADDDEEMAEGGKKGKKGSKRKDMQKKKKSTTWIKEDNDEVVDLLDSSAGQAIVSKRPMLKAVHRKEKSDESETGGFKIDKVTGKFIITEDRKEKPEGKDPSKIEYMEDLDEFFEIKAAQSGKAKKRKRTESGGSLDTDEPTAKRSTKVPGDEKIKKVAKKKHDYGADFRSKKAGGDMMKKGKVSPYAYVRFSKERLNKRKKAKYEGQFTSLVRGAKKGVAKAGRKVKSGRPGRGGGKSGKQKGKMRRH